MMSNNEGSDIQRSMDEYSSTYGATSNSFYTARGTSVESSQETAESDPEAALVRPHRTYTLTRER